MIILFLKRYKCIAICTSRVFLLSLFYQLFFPAMCMALTTGPSQPEVQSFEPVGTTDMVEMSTGDFTYNIPLLDVEGYPVNISYHGGIGMEQEASWVGLGWNINPGVINRTVRGLPDDFNGELLMKNFSMKPERNIRVGVGAGAEFAGLGDPLMGLSVNAGGSINFSNYKGVSADFDFGCGVNLFGCVSAGVNMGVGSQTGADIDLNAGMSFSSAQSAGKDIAGGVGINIGSGYNTRSGLKDIGLSVSTSGSLNGTSFKGPGFSTTIPIGLKNFVPVITNKSSILSIYGRIKVGGEVFYIYPWGNINGMYSKMTYSDADASRSSYGYLYSQNAPPNDMSIMDFSRDKDGMFNKKMEYLPMGTATYDIYSANGQGTGGNFRPYRNDFGSVYDPKVESTNNNSYSLQLEAGLGNLFEFGFDGSISHTDIYSGPWNSYKKGYQSKSKGSTYENVYFKQGGEITAQNETYFHDIDSFRAITPGKVSSLPLRKPGSTSKRDIRSNLFYYLNGSEASIPGVSTSSKIKSYESTDGFETGPEPATTDISRISNNEIGRKRHHISEVTQLQSDGSRYIYGIPAMNNLQREVTFSVNTGNLATELAPFSSTDDSKDNDKGVDNYYSATITPAYAHSYLLTSVLSADYSDVTGNGPSDDDMGTYTKFNYCRKDSDYRWKTPYPADSAQFNQGFQCDSRDNKASYLAGSREVWHLHSIESKNFIAEFYVSTRNDGKGSGMPIKAEGVYDVSPYNSSITPGHSYKLDSIKLYNKHDRFINQTSAIPIKTVIFTYSDDLCKGIPNVFSGSGTAGKLTLTGIYVKYGNSQKSLFSPYQFTYSDFNPNYNLAEKDRWGNYKPVGSLPNSEFPYVNQLDTNANDYASAWCLTQIQLPSGGKISVEYEQDDYAFVQDKVAAEMVPITGFGKKDSFSTNNGGELYEYTRKDKDPHNVVYVKRRMDRENPGLSLKDNYIGDMEYLYFSCNVKLTDKFSEQIRGYAPIAAFGLCPDNSDYIYIKMGSQIPNGMSHEINPVTQTAINVGRYNLSHLFYPGGDPDESGISNILAGLKQSFGELLRIGRNPIQRMLRKDKCKNATLSKSFIRLNCVGMKKIGGGQRVKRLTFTDNWSALAGGDELDASYGKEYDYSTTYSSTGQKISSGVSSYEPLIGGDENPFRSPIKYTAQSGGNFPPHDPIELFQENPIGESLFPSPTVVYSKVTIKSIHQDKGRSSQGMEEYEFYTAKDFPLKLENTAIQVSQERETSFFGQSNSFTGTQGYAITLNDMHGKPKSIKSYVRKPIGGVSELINSKEYEYYTNASGLENIIPTLEYDATTHQMKRVSRRVGIESDVTLDSRYRFEHTTNDNLNFNLNVVLWGVFPIPIPFGFPWHAEYDNEFKSAVATKVIQQYGIIKEIRSYDEGAITTVRNEAFDPLTGRALLSSVDNEFKDKEYSMSYPAYWAYRNMGGAYENIGFEEHLDSAFVNGEYQGEFHVADQSKYFLGDELLLRFHNSDSSEEYITTAWVMGLARTKEDSVGSMLTTCDLKIVPRFKYSTPGWLAGDSLNNIDMKVLRSGNRNLLDLTVQSYTSMQNPIGSGDSLRHQLYGLIDISANDYYVGSEADSVVIVNNANPNIAYMNWRKNDTLNYYPAGFYGIFRPAHQYVYLADRKYSGVSTRRQGLFDGNSYWKTFSSYTSPTCAIALPYMVRDNDEQWKMAKHVTKWTPWGQEIENRDALGNYSTAVYGYNEDLPVAVAQNAIQGEIFTDGFEDYQLLVPKNNWMQYVYAPFVHSFDLDDIGYGVLYQMYDVMPGSGLKLSKNIAHTGLYSLKTPSSANTGIANVYAQELNVMRLSDYNTSQQPNANRDYFEFQLSKGKKYILSYWVKKTDVMNNNLTKYTLPTNSIKVNTTNYPTKQTSNMIDGWQQVQCQFSVANYSDSVKLMLPLGANIDDIRIFPVDANMKSFVYHPVSEKLMATLDENNYATFYEYDQEGNLVRTKRESEKGIMTISESRSEKVKH